MSRGYLLLEGGAEFGGRMAEPDLRAIGLAGGVNASICIIPAAAAPDNNHARAGRNGVRWFTALGARKVVSLPLIDRESANLDSIAEIIRGARLLYMLGGFPQYLYQTLAGSLAWQAMREAHQAGAVIGGSSAGAMILCRHFYDPEKERLAEGLNLIPAGCLVPHHNKFGKGWVSHLASSLPAEVIIGIDEQTGMIDDGPGGKWTVYGKGRVTLYRGGKTEEYSRRETFSL